MTKIQLEKENESLRKKISDLEDDLDLAKSPIGEAAITSLGTIHIYNETGNLALQQHIDSFLSNIKEKYA